MNKKLLFGMFAAAGMLLATSCSKDELGDVQSGNEAAVSFNLGVENKVQTRAISDGSGAKKLVYAIYNADGNLITTISGADQNGQIVNESAFSGGLTDNVIVTLAKGQTYTAVFWAQNPNCTAYTTTDLTNVQVSYNNALNNDETRDAFFGKETFTVTGNTTIDVTLKRPFAQINVGVTQADWDAAEASGISIMQSTVKITNAATSINLLTGAATGEQEITYNLADIPTETLSADANNDGTKENYRWLSMSYILVADGSVDGTKRATAKTEFTFKPTSGNDITIANGLENIPVQRNWRTNILGQILSGNIQFNISIDPAFDGDYNTSVSVSTDLDLRKAVTSATVTNITLEKDLNLTTNVGSYVSMMYSKTIDLNNHTLTCNKKEIKIGASARNVHVVFKNGTIKSTSDNVNDSNVGLVLGSKNTTLELENVKYESNANWGAIFNADYQTGNKIIIRNSEVVVDGYYALTTNASSSATKPVATCDWELENSTFQSRVTPVLLNIPGNIKMTNCTVKGGNTHGVVLRGGNAEIIDCDFSVNHTTITTEDQANQWLHKYDNAAWGSGNSVPLAALTIGNKGTSYQYPTTVDMKNTKLTVNGTCADMFPVLYAHANEGENLGVTLTYDAKCNFYRNDKNVVASKGIIYGSANITANGVAQNVPATESEGATE